MKLFLFRRSGLVVLLVLILAHTAVGWRGKDHVLINLVACRQANALMPGFIAYQSLLGPMGVLPDVWKEDDPDEGPRHYIDLELYGYPSVHLVRDEPGLYDQTTGTTTLNEGIAPWIICQTLDQLTDAMRGTNWVTVTRLAAALGHYAGDLHMPLHTTANYNGQQTGNDGIHHRWESKMPAFKNLYRVMSTNAPVYIADPWAAVNSWMKESHQQIPPILAADTIASEQADNDLESSRYYNLLWDSTHHIYGKQIDLSAAHLADLWYTAWINAGKPNIPPPPSEVSEASIFYHQLPPAPKRSYTIWIFLAGFAIATTLILYKSIRKS